MRIYIDNFKVYNAVVSGFVNALKLRLRELDPTCPLLARGIPVMPDLNAEEWRVGPSSEEGESTPIAEIVEGMTQHVRLQALIVDMPMLEEMDVDPPD